MKKLLAVCLFITAATTSFAQMKEGKITYSMDMSTDDPEMAMALTMMQGSTMDVYFAPGKSRTDIKMGTMMSMTTIVDEKATNGLMLMDMMGQKTASEMPLEGLPKAQGGMNGTYEVTTETKEILGYKCTKAIMKTDEGELFVWFTKDITANMNGQMYFSNDMPGFPMEYQISAQGMTMNFTVKNIDKKVEKETFSTKIPEGYTVQSMEQAIQNQVEGQ